MKIIDQCRIIILYTLNCCNKILPILLFKSLSILTVLQWRINQNKFWTRPPSTLGQISFIFVQFLGNFCRITGWYFSSLGVGTLLWKILDLLCCAITQSMVWVNTWVFILRRYKWHIHAGSWSLVNCWREGSTLPYKGCS